MTRERLLPPHFSRTLLTIALPIILQNLMQSLVNTLLKKRWEKRYSLAAAQLRHARWPLAKSE